MPETAPVEVVVATGMLMSSATDVTSTATLLVNVTNRNYNTDVEVLRRLTIPPTDPKFSK